jgi:hypothetical protein
MNNLAAYPFSSFPQSAPHPLSHSTDEDSVTPTVTLEVAQQLHSKITFRDGD